tara:strand:- start:639 stop:1946 length:1308 start_codon:yes stop_codon:yes gene_type:complete
MAYNVTQTSSARILANKDKNYIKSIFFNKNIFSARASNAIITIEGSSAAMFSMTIERSSDNRKYNFVTNTFEATVTSQSRLKNSSPGTYNISIPAAASGDTYTFIIIPDASKNTELAFGKNSLYYSQTIEQIGDSQITITAAGNGFAGTTIGSNTQTSTTSFQQRNAPVIRAIDLQLDVSPAITDFGYFIKNTLPNNPNLGDFDNDVFYWQTTENIVTNPAGDGASGNSVTVADTSNLVVGMELTYHKTTTAPASTTTITSINTTTKTIEFSSNSPFEHGQTMTFRAYGFRLIERAIGIVLELDLVKVRLGQVTTSVRTAITAGQSTIDVNGMIGIGKGSEIRMRGLNKSTSSSATTVSLVNNTNGLTEGVLTIANAETNATVARPIPVRTKIYIDGSSNEVFLTANIYLRKFPRNNQTVILDLDRVLTQGLSGA